MIVRSADLRSWLAFTGIRDPEEAAGEISRLVQRLDDASDALNYVLRTVSGCPAEDTEELLRVARRAVAEAIDDLHDVAAALRRTGPDAA